LTPVLVLCPNTTIILNHLTRFSAVRRGVDGPERSGAVFRHLAFSRNACSGTYCQISRNALYWAFRYLFVTGQKGHLIFRRGGNEKFSGNDQKGHFEIFLERSGTSKFTSTPLAMRL